MSGNIGFVFKAFHLVMNVDKMSGSMFTQGLTDLKTIVEDEATIRRAA